MIKLTPFQAFHVFLKYVLSEENYWENSIELACVLSDISTNPEGACHTGGPTGDPAAWYSWCNLITEVLKDYALSIELISGNEASLTCEQAIKVMSYFLQKRYWDKNHEILLKAVILDLKECLSEQTLELTEIWKQWLECVAKGLMFNETFDESYARKLEEMRIEYWKAKGEWKWG